MLLTSNKVARHYGSAPLYTLLVDDVAELISFPMQGGSAVLAASRHPDTWTSRNLEPKALES